MSAQPSFDLGALIRRARAQVAREDRAARRSVVALLRRYARLFQWALAIPGMHYSGLTNQALLEVRQREGRDFAADTNALRAYVFDELALVFEGDTDEPSPEDLRRETAAAVRRWILKRVDYEVRDTPIPTLTLAYARRKARAGYGGRPVGVRTGMWRAAVAQARVDVIAP